jgi:hypothetical protein
MDPSKNPVAVGATVTGRLQLLPGCRIVVLATHRLFPVRAMAKSPLATNPKIETGLALVLLTVIVFGPKLFPTTTLPNPRPAGVPERAAVVPPVPVPVRLTSCGL